jgi:diaminopimelate decarboxylase
MQISIQEYNWVYMQDMIRKYFTPNGVSLEEIEGVTCDGVQINIDNLSILEQFGAKHPHVPVCIRINPHVMGWKHGYICWTY